MHRRVIGPILLAVLLIAVIAVWGTSRAEAVMRTTGACRDGSGITWKTRVDWGAAYKGSDGQRRVKVDFAGWTTDAQGSQHGFDRKDIQPGRHASPRAHEDECLRLQRWQELGRSQRGESRRWTGQDKITVSVGRDGDGKPNCVVETCPTGALEPSPTSTSSVPTSTVTATSAPNSSPSVPSPTVTATSAPNSSPSVLNLPRDTWEGPDYWKQFAKADAAGWDDPTFFPIAVFLGKPSHADALRALGVNTYMGAEHDGSSMSSITSRGISVLAQNEWSPSEVGNDTRVVGWHVSDECEMGYSECTPDWNNDNGEFGRLAVQQDYVNQFRSYQDGRFLQANFGNGVMGTFWAPNTMDDHIKLMDASSVDKYAYTSPGVRYEIKRSPEWPAGADAKRAATYGWLQDQMEGFQDPAEPKPNWVFVETARPFLTESGAETIATNQLSGAVWSAIIHGARGIAYFQHNNNGDCGTYSLVDCSQALKDTVRAVNSEVKNLAPVLNTQSYLWDFRAGADTMLKVKDGYAYIFAGVGLKDTPGSKTFTLPSGVNGSTVDVVGENRSVPVTNGKFTDTLATEYAHHIYKVALAN